MHTATRASGHPSKRHQIQGVASNPTRTLRPSMMTSWQYFLRSKHARKCTPKLALFERISTHLRKSTVQGVELFYGLQERLYASKINLLDAGVFLAGLSSTVQGPTDKTRPFKISGASLCCDMSSYSGIK